MKKARLPRTPKFRYHKATGQAYVEVDGRRIYLGLYERPQTELAYHELIHEWIANGRRMPVQSEEITVVEICARYWGHVTTYYTRPDGSPTETVDRVKRALRPLKEKYGVTNAATFGPKALRALREAWVDRGLARKTVNDNVAEIKRLFKWAASHELVPGSTYQALSTLDGLRKGRSRARETEGVKPVATAHVEAVRPFLSRQVNALIDLQLLSGARPSELLKLRSIDIDTSGEEWIARIGEHKNSYRGKERKLYFGKRGQVMLREFMKNRPVNEYLFSPREALQERGAKAETHRREGQPPTIRKTDRTVGEHYTVTSYRRAITRACLEAKVPNWTPHRLRHSSATVVRAEFGVEVASVFMGHSSVSVTEIYAEKNEQAALEVAARLG